MRLGLKYVLFYVFDFLYIVLCLREYNRLIINELDLLMVIVR